MGCSNAVSHRHRESLQLALLDFNESFKVGQPVTNGIGYLTVAAGQVVDGIKLHNVNSDMCISVPFPASPDGRFPELKEDCSKIPTDIPPTTAP